SSSVNLRQWQAEGGRFEVRNGRMAQGEAVAIAQGDIGLSPTGRLDGELSLAINDPDRFAQLLRRDHGGDETGFDRLARWLVPTPPGRLAFTPRAPTRVPDRNAQPPDKRPGDSPSPPTTAAGGDRSLKMPLRFTDEGIFAGPV